MPFPISEKSERALLGLFPRVAGRADAPTWLVDQVVDAELHRAGHPDATTGAFHALALKEGSLLKEEYDLSTHGHADGWVVEAAVVDPREFTLFNMRHGFPAGDAALKALVQALKRVLPTAKVVRTHTDGFAVLLGPTADARLRPEHLAELKRALPEAVAGASPAGAEPMAFTVGALRLTVVDPPHWQVLGPLVWAECERALVIARRAPFEGLLERRVVLDGRLPDFGR
ncbi:MAG: GGDEF domain-containing protein [Myxococcaceae bacterium]|jgi:GGDEF domain-containing protein|nr:GGDEF domain-containing protein [Myxococcaceae bacterium]MCA3010866.1 GGDEF domain-containing protein [Myxococcaceae bacterium]